MINQERLEALYTMTTAWGLKIIYAIVFAFVFWKIAGFVRKLVRRGFDKSQIDPAVSHFLSTIVYYLVLVAGMISMLSIFGIQTTSFAALLASMGLAVGLSLQGTLSHFAAGILLLVFRPFRVDDVIQVSGFTGKVVLIELLNTVLNTPDNRRIIIPNGNIFGSAIEVMTAYETRRVDITVGTSYDANLERTRETLERVAASLAEGLADPAPVIYLADLNASSVDWAVRVWVNTADYWPAREKLVLAIKNELDSAKIGIPYPHMEVVMHKEA